MDDDAHAKRVALVAARARKFYETKQPFRIFHGSTNSTRVQHFKRSETIDVSRLNHVLHIDTARRTALVEPNVPMDQLAKAALRHGLVAKVVMEFPGITVGGGIQGGAGESSSFRYGCFNQICNSYEMVLADGSIVTVSPDEHADLFYGTAGSFGTLGIITAAEVQLMPAKKYVQLTYLPVTSFNQAVEVLKTVTTQQYEYIDGIMFSATNGVIIAGKLTDRKLGRPPRFTRAHDPWYYLHVQEISDKAAEHTETVPLWDYLFRYDRGAFWVGRFAYELSGTPFNRFTRWVYNPLFKTRKLYQAIQASGAAQQHVVQDLALPQETAEAFMRFTDESFGIYPLWLCPLKTDDRSPFQSNNLETPLVINIGVWGNIVPSREAFLKANRDIEQKLAQLGGKKWFYAHAYYPEDEFWKLYGKQNYDKLRRTYHAEHLPTVYDKVTVRDTYPINLRRGALKTMGGLAKLRIEK